MAHSRALPAFMWRLGFGAPSLCGRTAMIMAVMREYIASALRELGFRRAIARGVLL